jgi:hypothetical protein
MADIPLSRAFLSMSGCALREDCGRLRGQAIPVPVELEITLFIFE